MLVLDLFGMNWGSSNLRVLRIDATGAVKDALLFPRGVATLDREGMRATVQEAQARWPDLREAYACGMVGSASGWAEAPYVACPAGIEDLRRDSVLVEIGDLRCAIVPGVALADDAPEPDVMRGEEVEIFGYLGARPVNAPVEFVMALPGTHTKWVRVRAGRIVDFSTAMTGEVFDRLADKGLLSAFLSGAAQDGAAFRAGVAAGRALGTGLARGLFGVRARVLRGRLAAEDAASYARGLLLGAEIEDALARFPDLARQNEVALIGNAALSALYAAALETVGVAAIAVDAVASAARGFARIAERVT